MSQAIARQVIGRINMVSSMVAVHGDIMGDLTQLAVADREKELAGIADARVELASAYGFEVSDTRKPFAFAAGIAIIPIHGTLINRFGQSYGYVTGYNFIRSQLALAVADPEVEGIILDCNSNGGEAAGCFETSDEVFAARGSKPIIAVVDSNCYSACYAIASAADRVIVTPTGGAGSIGVVAMHVSMKRMLNDFGVDIKLIYAGDHKIDGNPYEDLPDNVRADIQRGVDASRDKFVSVVARNRGMDESTVKGTQAAIYRAEEALEIGLVDEVATPQHAVAALIIELSGSTENLEIDMPKENADAPVAANQESLDAGTVQKAERERCAGILNCEEAKGNSTLANHLAFNTQLSVDEAKGMLTASAPVAAAPAVAAPVVTAPAATTFQQAMDNGSQPNVGADTEAAVEKADGGSRASRILANYKLVAGKDLH